MKPRHKWTIIASMDVDGGFSSAEPDKWYWCDRCGCLSLNKREFWRPGVQAVDAAGALKQGLRRVECR